MTQVASDTQPTWLARWWALLGHLDVWLLWLERVGMAVAAFTMGCVFIVMISGVFGRPWTGYLFTLSLDAGPMGLWPIAYLGAAYIWRYEGHVRFDLFLRRTRFRKHHVLQVANCLVGLAIVGPIIWQAWHSFQFHYDFGTTTQTLHFYVWPMYSTAFIGIGLLGVQILFSLGRHLREVFHPTGSET